MRRAAAVLAILLLSSCKGVRRADADAPPQEVEVTAYQWGFRPDVLRLRRGRPYRFRLRSIDVAHGFASEELGFSVAIPPKDQGEAELLLTPPRRGEFIVRCDRRSCGPGHRRMSLPVIVYE